MGSVSKDAAIAAGGPTFLEYRTTKLGGGAFTAFSEVVHTGTAVTWSEYEPRDVLVTICDEKDNYRFAFNGQEKVNEVNGIGNHNTALFWEYDTRLGRRWNLDPVDQISISNYAVMSLNPINRIDPLGNTDDNIYVNSETKTYSVQETNDPYDKVIEGKYDKDGKYTNTVKTENGVEKNYKPGTYQNKLKSEGYKELRGAQSEEFAVEMVALDGAGKGVGKGLKWAWGKTFGSTATKTAIATTTETTVTATAENAAGRSSSFFDGTRYTKKVLGQMKKGDFHAFPESVKAFESDGVISTIKGGDGVTRQMLKIPGEYGEKKGFFEFIKEADGSINHRLFRANP